MTNQLRSGDQAATASPAQIPMLLICCSAKSSGIDTFDPGDDVRATLGGGTGADATYAALRQGKGRVRTSACVQTWSPAPSVTHVGTGPTVTCALAAGAGGCFDDHIIKMRVSRAGAGGAGAAVAIAYDGSTEVEEIQIPAESPAVLRGTMDIAHGASLEGTHLDFTAPAAKVLTFIAGSLGAAAAGLKAATATVEAPVVLTAADLLTAGKAAILANPRRLTFATAGVTPADAPASVAIVGTRLGVAVSETLVLAQTAATVTSVNEYDVITSLTYPAADGTAATVAIGYTSAYATPAEIVTAFNALAVAAPLAVRARVAEDSSGHSFLELYSTSSGVTVTQTIDDAASTADILLGFSSAASNLTATGAAAKISPPWTGLSFTMPATSAYVLGDTYTAICTGPRASLGALNTAAIAAHDAAKVTPFGFLVVAQPASTAANCKATNDTLGALTAAWYADGKAPVPVTSVTGSPFHTASATAATNDANIATADAEMLTAFGAAAANLDSVAHGDCYFPGSSALVLGSFRRPSTIPWAAKRMSAEKIAADVADGLCVEVTLVGPDGLTLARDDNRAATKMGEATGFYAMQSTSAGLGFVKFSVGQTRAGSGSRLRYVGPVAVGLEIIRLVFPATELWKGQTGPAHPVTRMMSDGLRDERKKAVYQLLQPVLQPTGQPANVTSFDVLILDPPTGTWLDNGIVPVRIPYIPLGETTAVNIDVVATGQAIASP